MMLAGALALVVVAGTGGPVAGVAHRGADLLPTLRLVSPVPSKMGCSPGILAPTWNIRLA